MISFVDAYRDQHGVELICKVLPMPRAKFCVTASPLPPATCPIKQRGMIAFRSGRDIQEEASVNDAIDDARSTTDRVRYQWYCGK